MIARRRGWLLLLLLAVGVLVLVAGPAFGDAPDAVKTAKHAEPRTLQNLILMFVVLVLLCVGTGAAMAVLRVVLPGVAARADAAVLRLGAGRLFVTGILPLVGAALLGWAAGAGGVPALEVAYLLLVAIPLCLALLVGATAALPHLGARLLASGGEAGVLKQATVGGAVLGLAAATWVVPVLGLFLSFLVAGWLVGVGIGAVFPAPLPSAPHDVPEETPEGS